MGTNDTSVLEFEVPAGQVDSSAVEKLLAMPSRATVKQFAPTNPACLATLVGKLRGFDESGAPLVEFSGMAGQVPIQARLCCAVTATDIGRDVVLVFENGDPGKPIIMGMLQAPQGGSIEAALQPVSASIDGEEVVLSAKNEIVLRCGKSSITLTRAGKIIIRGAYLLSRSSGVNRIKGGSVQIN